MGHKATSYTPLNHNCWREEWVEVGSDLDQLASQALANHWATMAHDNIHTHRNVLPVPSSVSHLWWSPSCFSLWEEACDWMDCPGMVTDAWLVPAIPHWSWSVKDWGAGGECMSVHAQVQGLLFSYIIQTSQFWSATHSAQLVKRQVPCTANAGLTSR